MEKNNSRSTTRRGFLGSLAIGTTALGISAIAAPLTAHAENTTQFQPEDPDVWFNKVKGKHKVIFDATRTHEIFAFAWPKVFLLTNQATGTPPKDCGVVVVLRHDAIPYAFEDRLWAQYHFNDVFKVGDLGKAFKAADAATATATRNPFWQPKPGDFVMPAFGAVPIGINDLQADGVMFCVCDAAITVYSAAIAGAMNKDAAEVKKDWLAGLLPGIQVVPSGVWAIGRAQEHGCSYIFAG
jgi:hypothetical protein